MLTPERRTHMYRILHVCNTIAFVQGSSSTSLQYIECPAATQREWRDSQYVSSSVPSLPSSACGAVAPCRRRSAWLAPSSVATELLASHKDRHAVIERVGGRLGAVSLPSEPPPRADVFPQAHRVLRPRPRPVAVGALRHRCFAPSMLPSPDDPALLTGVPNARVGPCGRRYFLLLSPRVFRGATATWCQRNETSSHSARTRVRARESAHTCTRHVRASSAGMQARLWPASRPLALRRRPASQARNHACAERSGCPTAMPVTATPAARHAQARARPPPPPPPPALPACPFYPVCAAYLTAERPARPLGRLHCVGAVWRTRRPFLFFVFWICS